jgi:predicted nuclease of predicted toxin-antitoxin system
VRFFVDECISPSLSRFLNAGGLHDAIHPRDRGRLRDPDHVVFARAIAEDRIVVTENAEDFRKLAGSVELHPGLIVLPSVARSEPNGSWSLCSITSSIWAAIDRKICS